MIYVFGNSHASIFSNAPPCGNKVARTKIGLSPPNPDHPTLSCVFLGPVTAYNLYENEQYVPKISKILKDINADKTKDIIGLNMGEIDCRVHIPKRILLGGDQHSLVDECVRRYFKKIEELMTEGWELLVFGTHPTTIEGHDENPEQPHYGDCKFRNDICVEFNTILKELCDANELKFANVYHHLVDENNLTRMEYFIDYCHLSYEKCFPFFLTEMKRLGLSL